MILQYNCNNNHSSLRITRLFCGNLNKAITEEDLKSCLPGITYIKWITDKLTGEFYGSSFLEMKDAEAAAKAVLQDGSKFMGRSVYQSFFFFLILSQFHPQYRPLKIYYCPPRPTDTWPPVEGYQKKPGAAAKASNNKREKTPKPDGCRKLFVGNLSYEIDDDSMVDFFKDCGTMTGLRWLTRQDTGEFRVSSLLTLCILCCKCSFGTLFREVVMWSLVVRKKLIRRCYWMEKSY